MSKSPKEIKVPRKPRWLDVDETIWRQIKAAAALKGITMTDIIEEALAEWLAE